MTRGLLDTSVLIALGEGGLSPDLLPDEAAVSVATLAELHYGVLVARNEETRAVRLRRLGAVEGLFEALPIDRAVARAFGALAAESKRAGRAPRTRVMDLWIAATAVANGVPLWTLNPKDFLPLKRLVAIEPLR